MLDHPTRGARTLRTAALAIGPGLLALVVVAAQLHAGPDTRPPAAPTTAAASDVSAQFASQPAASIPATEPVRWLGQALLIDLDGVPLPQAIAWLAQATGTTVDGQHLVRGSEPVTLHLRTGAVTTAWQHLLHGRAAFSLSCSAARCHLWISSALVPATRDAEAPRPAPQVEAEPGGTPPAELEMSQPGGSC